MKKFLFMLASVVSIWGFNMNSASAGILDADYAELDYWETYADSTQGGQGYVYVPPGGKLGLYIDVFDGIVPYQVIGSNGITTKYRGTLYPSSKPVNIVTPYIGVGYYKVKLYCYEPPYNKGCHAKATISSQN